MPDLLTTQQVQNLLQIDRTTIYRLVESGKLPAIRVGKQWRFSREDIERWLQVQSVTSIQPLEAEANSAVSGTQDATTKPLQNLPATPALREILPLECSQMIQDEFARLLGVMMMVTDMHGVAITAVSNPCGYFTALTQSPEGVSLCLRHWQQLAANPTMQPAFLPNDMGFLCARGLIRVQSELKGMVVIGGIAPENWPPSMDQIAQLAENFGVGATYVQANVDAVYRLDKPGQEMALRSVQRIADIFSHIASDRNMLWGKLHTIASLTTL